MLLLPMGPGVAAVVAGAVGIVGVVVVLAVVLIRQEHAELTRVTLREQPGSHAGMRFAAFVEVAEAKVAFTVVVLRYVLQNLEADLVT